MASLRAYGSKAVASRHARIVDAVADVHAEGDLTVVVRLSRPTARC